MCKLNLLLFIFFIYFFIHLKVKCFNITNESDEIFINSTLTKNNYSVENELSCKLVTT